MAKDPTQGPVSTYDAEGNPITTNVDAPVEEVAVEETVEETAADESNVEKAEEEVESGEEIAPSQLEAEQAAMDAQDEIEASPDASEEEAAEVEETLWDRLTLTGAESDPEKGEARHVEFTCDRCGETKEGMLLPEGTVGFYALDDELGWAKYANEGEEIICDACMQSDERYLADYPDEAAAYAKVSESEDTIEEEAPVEEAEVTEEVVEPEEEEELETHEHEVATPLTYNEAETKLLDMPFLKLRELAIADGLKPERKKVKVIQQLLDVWFAPSEFPKEEEQPEMSVRVRRIKGLM